MMQELKPNTPLQGGKYVIKKVLGQGGFGITYLTEQVSLGREVAIKEFFMKDNCVRDGETGNVTVPTTGSAAQVEQYRKKFFKEARTLASFVHPNIVSVIDVFEENNTVYYSMPFMPGGSLKDLVERQGRLSEPEAMLYVRQVAEALLYMHQERHICHFDVKPANILLDNKGNAVLIDFGISKNYDANGNETSTTPIGLTQGFAPLEQYDGIKDFSPASDVYALGATLYFLLMGQVPPSALALVQGNATLTLDTNIPEQTKALVCKAMEPATSKRPQSVDCFLLPKSTAAPQQISDETIAVLPKELTPLGANEGMESHLQNSKTFKRLKIGGFTFLMVAIIAGLSWWAMRYDIVATKWLQIKAELGNATAQKELGWCYHEGKGVDKDDAEAAEWFRKAAEKGNAEAQNYLACCYDEGKGVEKNYTEALKWYRKAAEQDLDVAQYNLGIYYDEGRGVEKDDAEAVKWYLKAAEQGYADAQNNLGVSYDEGRGVEENYTEAFKWYLKAAEQGNAAAQNNLGFCYDKGRGVEKNAAEAVKWYRKAAEQGLDVAQHNLALSYDKGSGVEKNHTEALKWYRKAAKQGYADAQYLLAVIYEEGKAGAKNKAEAVKWYRKAAASGNEDAKVALKRLGASE